MTIAIGDLLPHHQGQIALRGGVDVHLIYQMTPFGQRRYFLCPVCTRKCAKLHLYGVRWYCQVCAPFRVYQKRQDLYDRGRDLIKWRMDKLLKDNGLHNLWKRPRGMHSRRFETISLQLKVTHKLM